MRFVWNEGRHIKIDPKDYKTADPWGDIPGALQIAGLRHPKAGVATPKQHASEGRIVPLACGC